ncbi:hepatocyte growth factor-regulated tyrosine kinase substrate isoform X2 [Sitophilus oryzae]|uniref:Hepatocyte growth factor-regulated tyrosine kinase substrate n=1 Tax=Sitophilus oryzae TaxID=7048 RepID=A0A6J2XLN7_SITOR|nr:hepatocyte growth factor-regulated tyrosine kinase substrate isoform X2 [Sitophilus oryzae]
MFRTAGFEKLLDKATSHLLMEPDWPTIIQICDLIRQNDVQPKNALNSIKKKLCATNPHSTFYALLVLESIVKNCGTIVHEELTSKAYCEFLHELVKTTTHDNVRQKLLELIQVWSFAFRKNPKHGNLKDLMNLMKAEGYKFPVLRESDAMFAADTAPEWADGDVCHRCRVQFSMIQRKHHCRACGQVFCASCTSKTTTLPKYGIEKEVRVCDTCFDTANKPSTGAKTPKTETELPAEYLKSSLAQQSQEPPRKSEDELREEEELQLALALSQSEAEAKEKEKLRATNALLNPTKKSEPVVNRSPSPQEETTNPELDRYLNRSYWESVQSQDTTERPTSPSAPSPASSILSNEPKFRIKENGVTDGDLEEFVKTLKSQVEIFINRMKSNSSRGRSIANDTSVQTLFMNTTNLHSRLLKYIQEHDDRRLYYERLQDKLTQVKDARAALDALREEHRDRLRREAEEAERQRQLQMAHKLEIMRKKKQEYLQYQRQLALQRIQEQEREMQMRQEQQKQQYLMGPQQFAGFIGSPVHNQQFQQPNNPPVGNYYGQYGQMLPQAPNSAPPGIPSTLQGGSGGPPQTPQIGPPQQFIPQMPNMPPNNSAPSGGAFSPPSGMIRGPMVPGPNHGIPQSAPPSSGLQQVPFPNHNVPQGQNNPPPPLQGQQSVEQTQTAELISFD